MEAKQRLQNNQYAVNHRDKRTLNLTSLTVNAMALIAPGAFLWTTFQLQAAQMNGSISTAGEMWTGLVAALVLAFLTAVSYGELSDIYPRAGSGSSYISLKPLFWKKKRPSPAIRSYCQIWHRLDFPSVLLDISRYYGSFLGNLIVYIFGLFGVALNVPEEILVAAVFAIINGYIAFPGCHRFFDDIYSYQRNSTCFIDVIFNMAIVYRVCSPRTGICGNRAVHSAAAQFH